MKPIITLNFLVYLLRKKTETKSETLKCCIVAFKYVVSVFYCYLFLMLMSVQLSYEYIYMTNSSCLYDIIMSLKWRYRIAASDSLQKSLYHQIFSSVTIITNSLPSKQSHVPCLAWPQLFLLPLQRPNLFTVNFTKCFSKHSFSQLFCFLSRLNLFIAQFGSQPLK